MGQFEFLLVTPNETIRSELRFSKADLEGSAQGLLQLMWSRRPNFQHSLRGVCVLCVDWRRRAVVQQRQGANNLPSHILDGDPNERHKHVPLDRLSVVDLPDV